MVMEITGIVKVAGFPCEINETFQTKQTQGGYCCSNARRIPKKPIQWKEGVYDVTVTGAENEISGLSSSSALDFGVHFHPYTLRKTMNPLLLPPVIA